ncbi:hypothetical protein YB2330_005045 [Saitoella coloradoensis]
MDATTTTTSTSPLRKPRPLAIRPGSRRTHFKRAPKRSSPPFLPPSYISPPSASAILSASSIARKISLRFPYAEVCVGEKGLRLVNLYLDYLLRRILSAAAEHQVEMGIGLRGIGVRGVREGLQRVLPERVARDACADGEAELKTYLGSNIEDDLNPSPSPSTGGVEESFDVQKAWEYARLKCMIYSTIGDVEEEYVNFILGAEHALPPATEPTGPNDITPAAAIFLTAALELLGENLLLTAIRAARNRVRSANNLQFMGAEGGGVQFFIEEQDVAKGATSSDEKAKRLWADFVEDSHNAIPTVTSSVVRKEPEVLPLRPAGLSPIFEEVGTFEGVGVGVGVHAGTLPSPPISAHSSGSQVQQKQFVGQQTLQVPGIQLAPPTPGSEEGPVQGQSQLARRGLGFDFGDFHETLGEFDASAGGMRESGMFEPIRDSIYGGPVEGSVDAAFTEMENDLRGQQVVVTDGHVGEQVFVSTSNDLVEGEPVTPVMQTGLFAQTNDSDYVPFRKSSIVVSDADLESESERLRQHSIASLVGVDGRRPSAVDSEMTESDVEDVQVFTAHVASIAKAEVTLSPSRVGTVSSHRSSDEDLRERHRGHGFVQDSPTIVRTRSRSRDTFDRPLSPSLSEGSWKSPTKSVKMSLKRSPELTGEEWGTSMRRSGSSSSFGRKSVLEEDETPEQAAKRLEFEALLAAGETKKITLNIGELKKIETQKRTMSPRQIPRSPLAVGSDDDDDNDPFMDSPRKVRSAPTENLAKFIRSTGPEGEVISHEVVATSPIISSPGTPRSVPLIAPPTVVNPIPSPAMQSCSPSRTAPKRSIAEIRAAAGLAPREPTVQKHESTYDLVDFLRNTDPTNLKPADLAGSSKTSPDKKQVSFTHDTATLTSASADTDSLSYAPTFGSNSFYQAKRISEDKKTISSSVATTPILAQSTADPNSPSLKSTKSMSQGVHGSPASTSSKRFADKSRMPQSRGMVPRAPTKDLEDDENDAAMDSDEELLREYSRKPRKLVSKDESLADFLREMPPPLSSSRALPSPVAEPVKKSKGLFGSRRGKNDSPNKSKSQPLVSPSAEVMLGRFK